MKTDLTTFVKSYLETAAWVTVEDSNENDEFTKAAIKHAESDCKLFVELVTKAFGEPLASELLDVQGNDVNSRTAHDFFLTRNGHGAGFWDNPENYQGQENADKLTVIAKSFSNVDVIHSRGPKSKLTFF